MDGQGDFKDVSDLDRDEEIVQVKPDISGDFADVSISCSDATGLGCDIARVIFNFGLTVYNGDFSTDGRWCFVMLHVRPCFGNPPCASNWGLLKRHLLRVCYSERRVGNSTTTNGYQGNKKFILQIQFQDKIGTLHNIIHCLWESDLVVHKANISTSPDDKGLDVFYVSDKHDKLPKQSRINQIQAVINKNMKGCSDLKLHCHAYPTSNFSSRTSSRLLTGTRACKDSRSTLPLLRTLSNRDRNGSRRSSNGSESLDLLPKFNVAEIIKTLKVHADNLVSSTHTVLQIECIDRKGLMYDLFRIAKDIGLQISYGKISLDEVGKLCKADLFVHECEFGQKLNDEAIAFTCTEIKNAITSSILVKVHNKMQDMADSPRTILQTEVLAVAPVDSGFRGRPRVLYDLTATFHALDVSIFHAEMYTVEIQDGGDPSDKRYQEVHRFVIQGKNGKPISSREDLEVIETELYSRLIGNNSETTNSSSEYTNVQVLEQFIQYGILD